MVGATSVLTDLAVYALLLRTGAVGVSAAKGCSYLAGVAIGFALNKRWTFESSRRSAPEAIRYLLLYGATFAVNIACNNLALALFGAESHGVAFLLATAVTTVLNFLGMRLFAFRVGIADRRTQSTGELPSAAAPLHRAA